MPRLQNVTVGKVLDRIEALRKEKAVAIAEAQDKVELRYQEKEDQLRRMLSQEDQNKVTVALLAMQREENAAEQSKEEAETDD